MTTDPQDPLPESNWFWRRVFACVVTAAALALTGLIVWQMTAALLVIVRGDADATATVNALRDIAFYLVGLALALSIAYLIAPSGEQVAKMVQSVKLNLGGSVAAAPPAPRVVPDDEPDFEERK